MMITGLDEHDSVPWEALPGRMDADPAAASGASATAPGASPTTYTLQAVKPPPIESDDHSGQIRYIRVVRTAQAWPSAAFRAARSGEPKTTRLRVAT